MNAQEDPDRAIARRMVQEIFDNINHCGCPTENHIKKRRRSPGGPSGRRGKLAFAISIVPSLKPKLVRLTNSSLKTLVTALAKAPGTAGSLTYLDPISGQQHQYPIFNDLLNSGLQKEEMWRRLFCFERRTFSEVTNFNQMSLVTDGCSVSVKITTPKTVDEIEEERLQEATGKAKQERRRKAEEGHHHHR